MQVGYTALSTSQKNLKRFGKITSNGWDYNMKIFTPNAMDLVIMHMDYKYNSKYIFSMPNILLAEDCIFSFPIIFIRVSEKCYSL